MNESIDKNDLYMTRWIERKYRALMCDMTPMDKTSETFKVSWIVR